MRKLISDTAKWGELTVGPKIIDQTVQKHMRSVLRDIRSGNLRANLFARWEPARGVARICCAKLKRTRLKKLARDCAA